jgi:hypothetical protein
MLIKKRDITCSASDRCTSQHVLCRPRQLLQGQARGKKQPISNYQVQSPVIAN